MAEPDKALVAECLQIVGNRLSQLDTLVDAPGGEIDSRIFRSVANDLHAVVGKLPTHVPPFDEAAFVSRVDKGVRYYRLPTLRAHLAATVSRLGGAAPGPSPFVPAAGTPREFPFVGDPALRHILERDYAEMQRLRKLGSWKVSVVLAGGIVEGMLIDQLVRDPHRARSARKSPSDDSIERWDLRDLIDVASRLGLVKAAEKSLSHAVRLYRNAIHPAAEARDEREIGEAEVRIAEEVIQILSRALEK